MKLIPKRRKKIIVKVANARRKRNIKRCKIRLYKKLVLNGELNPTKKNNYKKQEYVKINAPSILGFSSFKSRMELVRFLNKIYRTTIKNNQKISINFSNSKNAESFGFISILSTIDRIQTIKGTSFVIGNEPLDDTASQVFHQIGLSKMLSLPNSRKVTHENVVYWKHVKGTRIEVDNAGLIIVDIINKFNIGDETSMTLYNGVTEAITNTVMHAYKNKVDDNNLHHKDKWWMFTGVKDGELVVVLCDLGIGIPASLREKHPSLVKKFFSYFHEHNDGELIRIAIEEGKSSSGESHRGLGMTEMKKFNKSIGKGELCIMSGNGGYWFFGDKDEEKTRNLIVPIVGTIVGWKVPVDTLEKMDA